jgi:hypothetical protein
LAYFLSSLLRNVNLIGDAAHAMQPIGLQAGSQATGSTRLFDATFTPQKANCASRDKSCGGRRRRAAVPWWPYDDRRASADRNVA